jgi:hypothetical protein
MPQASKADITVPQLKASLTIKEPTMQQQNTLVAEGQMYSTVLIDPACMIQPEDFLQKGQLSMIYVPNYIYICPSTSSRDTHMSPSHNPG